MAATMAMTQRMEFAVLVFFALHACLCLQYSTRVSLHYTLVFVVDACHGSDTVVFPWHARARSATIERVVFAV